MDASVETPDLPDSRSSPVRPVGLRRLIAFQFWDSLAFAGSRLLLVLFLIALFARPGAADGIWGLRPFQAWAAARLGLVSQQAFIAALAGLFGALAYLTPLIGGALSDRLISRRNAAITGGLMMAAGHGLLALGSPFLVGLLLLACGNGFYRGSVGPTLAGLFRPGDARVAGAFQLSYMAANAGLVAASLLCGSLGELVGWSWGFGAAAAAMLVGLAIYISIPAAVVDDRGDRRPATRGTRIPLWPRLLLIGGIALFMIGNEQLSNAMVVWFKGAVDRRVGSGTIPLTWFFAVTPLSIIASTVFLSRRPLDDAVGGLRLRMVGGCVLGAGAWALLSLAARGSPVAALWPILFLLLWGLAFALVVASGAALTAVLTPPDARGRWLGLYFFVGMIANIAVGAIGGFYGRMVPSAFIALHGALVLAAGAVLAALPRTARAVPQ